ncbi:MAG: metallophosphoesterase family protein [Phototrophicaceae bacterium]
MKILCVSDTVMPQMENPANLRRQYGDIELIISCGDLPSVYLEFMTSVLNVPLFYVRGNHDEQYEEHPPGGNDLHQRLLEFNGLTFFGLEGSIRYNRSPIQYSDQQMNQMVLTAFPILQFNNFRRGRLDVLVTHSPARGIHDADDIPHQGFGSLLRFMEWYKPRYMLHGHVHTWDRRKQTRSTFHETEIININPVSVLEIDTD